MRLLLRPDVLPWDSALGYLYGAIWVDMERQQGKVLARCLPPAMSCQG